jgi:hypothetical protein
MPKIPFPSTYVDPCHIRHIKKGYWQCGVWVDSIHDATKYMTPEEAEKVILLRHLHGVDIISASR